MRCTLAFALLVCCGVLPMQAQRGGMRGGGMGHPTGGFGGFGGGTHGSGSFRAGAGSFRAAGPGFGRASFGARGLRGTPRFFGAGAYRAPFPSRASASGGYRAGYALNRGRSPYRGRWDRSRGGYAGYAFAGPLYFGSVEPFWDFADTFGYDNASPYGAPYTAPDTTNAYAEPGESEAPPMYAGPPANGGQSMVYAPYAYGQPQVTVVTLPAPPPEEDAVTIFFRDGRRPEQIRNYALTRTSLLITGPRMREISLSDIDLPLTERVNEAAGVEFRLP